MGGGHNEEFTTCVRETTSQNIKSTAIDALALMILFIESASILNWTRSLELHSFRLKFLQETIIYNQAEVWDLRVWSNLSSTPRPNALVIPVVN